MRWMNGRLHRLAAWAGLIRSPHFELRGRKPTFREAWTGVIDCKINPWADIYIAGFKAGLREQEARNGNRRGS